MNNQEINQHHQATFDSIKHFDEQGNEYWYARDLAPVLDYRQWRNFLPVLTKAQAACNNSQQLVSDHFAHIRKMVDIGSGAARELDDLRLTRYACYLIVQNGNPNKPVIANGQTYFAVQARRQELAEDNSILDRMGSTELAANLFRATQTEEKLRRDNIQGKQHANQTHFNVGHKVRQTIEELGGTMPEELPVAEKSIKQLEAEKKKQLKALANPTQQESDQ